MVRSIPPITSTGSAPKRRISFSSMDPIKFRTRGSSLNIGIGNIGNKFNRQESFKPSSGKKSKVVKSNYKFSLEKLLTQTEKKLEKVMGELKTTYLDELSDEYTKLDNFIRQLRWQIAVRKER